MLLLTFDISLGGGCSWKPISLVQENVTRHAAYCHRRIKWLTALAQNSSLPKYPMMSFALRSAFRAAPRQASAIRAARRSYADVADGKLQLSLVLPHQVSSVTVQECLSLSFATVLMCLPSILDAKDPH